MGIVYKARDLKLDRFVALKFLSLHLTSSEEEKQRFIVEAKAASSLQHHNICTIHEIDEADDGQMYIVMDYYEGETLKDKIKDKRLKINEAIDYTIQIAEGLKKAHEKGIIHKDIKPANIIITNDNEVKILDFGLSKFKGHSDLARSNYTAGTLSYMSPEQLWDNSIDSKTDIWSLGVVLFEMLSGQLPFSGNIDQAIIYSISKEKPKSLTNLDSKVSKRFEQIIFKALEKNTENRYQTIGDMLQDLQLTSELNNDRRRSPKKYSKRSIYWITGSILFMVLILLGSYLFKPVSLYYDYRKVIAVVPFENLSKHGEYEYISDAISEDIRRQLSRISSIEVISRERMDAYKDSINSQSVIEENLHIGTLLKGSVKRKGIHVNILIALYDARTGEQLWRKNYDQGFEDIFGIQNDIVERIALALDIELTVNEKNKITQKPTSNITAYDYYLEGREHLYHGRIQYAIDCFNMAFRLDPSYSQAYTSLAQVRSYGAWIVILSGN